MTTFDSTSVLLTASYIEGALQNVPEAQQTELAKQCLRDAFRSGFQIGFNLGRTTTEDEIPAPKTPVFNTANAKPKEPRIKR